MLKAAVIVLSLLAAHAHAQPSAPARNIIEYNLTGTLGLKGYDPVAVFPEGGGQAVLGDPSLSLEEGGVTYNFATPQNRATFALHPEIFEPTYGGWCAYAMSSGSKVDIQPQLFTIHGHRAHYFVSARAKQNFDRDVEGHEQLADGFWKMISGEEPRL